MKVLVIGGGGREHAVIEKIRENKSVTKIYALPGNGGIAQHAECVAIGAKEIDKIKAFAVEKKIDFAIVTPDDPLVLGAVDELEAVGVQCFGPNKAAAIIEGSKVFSKNLMKKYNIPTADYEVFDSCDAAKAYIEAHNVFPIVIKADGLALGKGVLIAQTKEEAIGAIDSIMTDKLFGDSGNNIVIEEFLTGPEVSVLAFTDSKTMVPMVSSMDHKRALDGDEGPNTGGMGTIAPNPYYTDDISMQCMDKIFIPTMKAMNAEGRPFKGCLYFGLMLTPDGPKVIEYNCRFGDPETQVVLPLLSTDLLEIMQAVRNERLSDIEVNFRNAAACCIVVASGGYPGKYQTGCEITFGDIGNAVVFHAGTKAVDDKILTSGGRVLGITATAESLHTAVRKAYLAVEGIHFKDAFYRKDIGKKALDATM